MKTFLPWIIIVALLGGIYFLYSANKDKDADLAKQAVELQDMDKLRADSEELKKSAGDKDELIRLRKENAVMLKIFGAIVVAFLVLALLPLGGLILAQPARLTTALPPMVSICTR